MSDVIEALKAERNAYEARGLAGRVAEVDAALKALGVDEAPIEQATAAPGERRSTKRAAKKAAARKG